MYICVVCSLNRPPLQPLTIELRQLLETLVSPITTADINASYLLLCSDCQIQMQSVHQFQKMALNGLRNLRQLLNIQPENGGYSHPDLSIPLKEEPLKTEPELEAESHPGCHAPQSDCHVLHPDCHVLHPDCHVLQPDCHAPQSDCHVLHPDCHVLHPDCHVLQPDCHAPQSDCHVPQPDCKSEVKEAGPAFEPQYEVNCEFACFEPNIELTIGERENPSHLKFKPPNTPQPERTANKAKSTKVARKAKLATTAKLKAKDAENATSKDVKENSVAPAKKKRVQKKPQPVPCPHCHRMFKGVYNLRAHFDSQHAEKKPVRCDICGRIFRNAETLRRHKYHHKRDDKLRPETFCVECSLRFSTPAHYKAHLLSLKHTPREQYEFECEVCKMKFPTEKRLKEHVDGVHLGMKKFTCVTCEWSFTNRSALRRHVSREHETRTPRKTHVCDLCGKTFMVKKCLEEHLLVHRGLRPYKCAVCAADFSYKAALYTHNQLKHLKKGKNKEED